MVKPQAGNPLWVEWLENHSKTLEESGNKSSQAYKKAARNLSKCPVPYIHPSEAVVLEGIGPGIVSYLVKKLTDYCEANHEEMPDRVGAIPKARAPAKRKKPTAADEDERDAAKEARRNRTMGIAAPAGTFYPLAGGGSPLNSDDAPPAKKRKAPTTKTYVPKLRSGPFAILLSLYQCASSTNPNRWTLKDEILQFATDLCDVPFDTPSANKGGSAEGGSNYNYSGWSSMKTLVSKELVTELNKRPKKWSLTDTGYALAHKLASTADVAKHLSQPSSSSNVLSDGISRRVQDDWGQGHILGNGSSSGIGKKAPVKKNSTTNKSAAIKEAEEADADFARDLEKAMEMSRRESSEAVPSRSNLGASTSKARAFASDLEELSTSTIKGKKAAQGFYAGQGPSAPTPKISHLADTPFLYYYLDEVDNRVPRRDSAEVGLEEGTTNQVYRIEFRISQESHSMTRNVVRQSPLDRSKVQPGGPTKSGYLRSRVANDSCPGFSKEREIISSKSQDSMLELMGSYKAPSKYDPSAMYAAPSTIRRTGSDNHPSSGSDLHNRSTSLKESTTSRSNEASTSNIKRTQSAPSNIIRPPSISTSTTNTSSTSTLKSNSSKIIPTCFDPAPNQIVNRHPLDPVRDHISSVAYTFPRIQENIYRSGSFKIVLIIDTREIGTSKANRMEIIDKLKEKGVRVDRKMLPLGDMLWVARKFNSAGVETGEDDIVLDAIVERKRLDDLCRSILDGRYLAQKVRIKDSAISHRIYLIEKYDTAGQYAQFGKQIWTSKSQLQVNDGFYVHESANINDTINYLAQRTQIMTELYEKSDLYIIPDAHIDRQSYLSLQQHLRSTRPTENFLTTYKSFENLNRTDAALTLKVQWATMIQHISGVSAEKALQFSRRWSTPAQFYEESKERRLEVEEEEWRLEQQEEAGGGNSITGSGGKGKGKKRRKAEDFVVEELGLEELRGIKGKLGAKMFNLFAADSYDGI